MSSAIDEPQPSTMPWAGRAACAPGQGHDPEIWFPKSKLGDYQPGRPQSEHIVAAKAVCAGCAVRKKCLDYALADRHLIGIWGGLTEQERLRQARSRPVGQARSRPE